MTYIQKNAKKILKREKQRQLKKAEKPKENNNYCSERLVLDILLSFFFVYYIHL
jgi:hypothetical protein